jgi:hypothetical protein
MRRIYRGMRRLRRRMKGWMWIHLAVAAVRHAYRNDQNRPSEQNKSDEENGSISRDTINEKAWSKQEYNLKGDETGEE